jgi:hypothetical protein
MDDKRYGAGMSIKELRNLPGSQPPEIEHLEKGAWLNMTFAHFLIISSAESIPENEGMNGLGPNPAEYCP